MNDISIIIPVYKDETLKKCLNSILDDDKAEIIVVFNGTPVYLMNDYHELLVNKKVKVINLGKANKSIAYNEGIKNVTTDKIIFMDADCVFLDNCIKMINKELDVNSIVKGRVNFSYDNLISKIISRARHIHTNLKRAYTPPLGFQKKVIVEFDQPLFCEELSATEDFDLEMRRRKNKVALSYLDHARVEHPPIGFIQELKTGYRYGKGHAEGVRYERTGYIKPSRLKIRGMIEVINKYKLKYGLLTSFFLILWNIWFSKGFRMEWKKNET